jgi:hypothetical protein
MPPLARAVVPWQEVQVVAVVTVMVPSMWVASAPRVMVPVVAPVLV